MTISYIIHRWSGQKLKASFIGLFENNILGHSNHKMTDLYSWWRQKRGVSKIAILQFQRTDIGWESPLGDSPVGQRAPKGWTSLKKEILKMQEQAVPASCKTRQHERRLPAQTASFCWDSRKKKKKKFTIFGRSRQLKKNRRMLLEYAEGKLEQQESS